MPERHRRNSEATRERILEAARELFVDLGYEAVTVRRVAARSGISHGSIYLYFRDKDDLLTQVSEEQFTRLVSVLRRLPRTREPAERLADALGAIGAFGVANTHEFNLMIGAYAAIVGRGARSDWGPMAEQLNNVMTDLVLEFPVNPASDRADATQLAWILTASVSGAVLLAQAQDLPSDEAAAVMARQADILVSGLMQTLQGRR
jgi:AcrR family transcriptional regulator